MVPHAGPGYTTHVSNRIFITRMAHGQKKTKLREAMFIQETQLTFGTTNFRSDATDGISACASSRPINESQEA